VIVAVSVGAAGTMASIGIVVVHSEQEIQKQLWSKMTQ